MSTGLSGGLDTGVQSLRGTATKSELNVYLVTSTWDDY